MEGSSEEEKKYLMKERKAGHGDDIERMRVFVAGRTMTEGKDEVIIMWLDDTRMIPEKKRDNRMDEHKQDFKPESFYRSLLRLLPPQPDPRISG